MVRNLLISLLATLFLCGCAAVPNVPDPLPESEPMVVPDCSATVIQVEKYMNKRASNFVNDKAEVLKVKISVPDYTCINEMLAKITVDIYMEWMSPIMKRDGTEGPKVKWCGTTRIEGLAAFDGFDYFKFEPQSMNILSLDICN